MLRFPSVPWPRASLGSRKISFVIVFSVIIASRVKKKITDRTLKRSLGKSVFLSVYLQKSCYSTAMCMFTSLGTCLSFLSVHFRMLLFQIPFACSPFLPPDCETGNMFSSFVPKILGTAPDGGWFHPCHLHSVLAVSHHRPLKRSHIIWWASEQLTVVETPCCYLHRTRREPVIIAGERPIICTHSTVPSRGPPPITQGVRMGTPVYPLKEN